MRLIEGKLTALSPKSVLQRGYAICRNYPDLEIIRSFEQVKTEDKIKIELAKGSIFGKVDRATED